MSGRVHAEAQAAPKSSFAPVRTGLLQRSSASHAGPATVPPIVHEVLRSSGQPLDADTRTFMEPRFGHDFSRVHVHTDPKATESARQTNALSYTVGRDVVFASGQYIPHSSTGLRLIAHELAHVVQQSPPAVDGATSALQVAAHTANLHSNSLLALGQENDFLEQEADRASDAVMNGNFAPQPLTLQYGSARNVLQREPEAGPRSRRRPRSAAVLRYMAARPSFALHDWRAISQEERDSVLWEIIYRYGPEFALQFREYAQGRQHPVFVTEYTNLPGVTPQSLTARGYRLAGNFGGPPTWVHPSGREVCVVTRSASRPSEAQPAPGTAPEEEETERSDIQSRCADPCMEEADNREECDACCERIPESDQRCRRACEVSCAMNILW